jgi:hypothetical protein
VTLTASLPAPEHEPGVSGPSNGPLTAVPQTALTALAASNPRYLSAAERRLLQGLYPELSAPDLPRLRTLPEVSADERAHAVALARAGASVNALVRGFCLTRWTALSLHREGRPQTERTPVQAHEPAPAVEQPELAPAPESESAPPVTPAPKPAESTADIVARINARARADAPREHAPKPVPRARESEPADLVSELQQRIERGRW